MQPSHPTLAERIEKIVRPNLKFLRGDLPIDPEQNLGELGLDSMASINLLLDLESEFGVVIPDDSLDENTFSSIASLESMLSRLTTVAA